MRTRNQELPYLCQRARNNFQTFCQLMHPEGESTYGNNPVIWSKCHTHLMSIVQSVADRVVLNRKLNGAPLPSLKQCVSMPPQTGKSFVLSTLAPAWILGLNPAFRIGLISFSNDLSKKFNASIRRIMKRNEYKMIFPSVVLGDVDRQDYFETSEEGWIQSKSTNRNFTGQGLDWLIVDDVYSGREDAESPKLRDKIKTWFLADCMSRLSPKAPVFLIGTRWFHEDLIGYLTSEDYEDEILSSDPNTELFQKTNLPAICVDPSIDPIGREEGESVFPEWKSVDRLNQIKAGIPNYEWESQYQGNPQMRGGGVADLSKLNYISETELPEGLEWVRGYDLAVSESDFADYTASCKLAIDEHENVYISDMQRNRLSWPRNEAAIVAIGKQEKIRIRIEAVAGFLACFQAVKKQLLGHCLVEKSTPKNDKLVNANRWLPKVEAGKVFLVRGDWNKEFVAELQSFPVGQHDDMVDSFSIAYLCALRTKTQKPKFDENGRRIRPKVVRRPSRNRNQHQPTNTFRNAGEESK